ncbi:MAG TPA: single-stranded DNA-binding protein [Candidatus Dormibacteraeota bacterium]|jgi:single-strand DNA-binding protein|nr:single-stranded DNA-binding protein [Candidatus Dormibacteraeota bacterium]
MINRVTIVGRLTRDPEVHDTAAGGKLANLRVVTSEYRKGEDGQRREEVQYHSVVAFGRLGEVCAEYLRKGRLIYLEGKLRTREWDGRDGLHRYTTEVIAEFMQMLSPRASEEAGADTAAEAELPAAAQEARVPAGVGA